MVYRQEDLSPEKTATPVCFAVVGFILLPRSSNGNYNASKPVVTQGRPMADGGPMPPSFSPEPVAGGGFALLYF
jgi:hypothetical protein